MASSCGTDELNMASCSTEELLSHVKSEPESTSSSSSSSDDDDNSEEIDDGGCSNHKDKGSRVDPDAMKKPDEVLNDMDLGSGAVNEYIKGDPLLDMLNVVLKDESNPNIAFRCKVCGYRTKRLATLRRHEAAHDDGVLFSCNYCDFTHRQEERVRTHEAKHKGEKPFKCTECSFASRCKGDLTKHQRVHSSERKFKCHLCPFSCKWKTNLSKHVQCTHTENRPYQCSQCDLTFKHPSALKSHQRSHSDQKPHRCNLCGFRARTRYEVDSHKTIHSDVRMFPCPFPGCTQKCKRKPDLTKHIKTHSETAKFQCDLCQRKFKLKISLRSHIKSHLERGEPHECPVCHKILYSRTGFQNHVYKHRSQRRYMCSICGHLFFTKSNMVKHMEVHSTDRNLICPICSLRSDSRKNFLIHVGHEHLKEYRYFCELCRKPFASFTPMRLHIERCHKDVTDRKVLEFVYDPECSLKEELRDSSEKETTRAGEVALPISTKGCSSDNNCESNNVDEQINSGKSSCDPAGEGCHGRTGETAGSEVSPSKDTKSSVVNMPDHNGTNAHGMILFDGSSVDGADAVVSSSGSSKDGANAVVSDSPLGMTENKDHGVSVIKPKVLPDWVRIGNYGGVGVCLAHKNAQIVFNFAKNGKKPRKWFMEPERMPEEEAEKMRKYLQRKRVKSVYDLPAGCGRRKKGRGRGKTGLNRPSRSLQKRRRLTAKSQVDTSLSDSENVTTDEDKIKDDNELSNFEIKVELDVAENDLSHNDGDNEEKDGERKKSDVQEGYFGTGVQGAGEFNFEEVRPRLGQDELFKTVEMSSDIMVGPSHSRSHSTRDTLSVPANNGDIQRVRRPMCRQQKVRRFESSSSKMMKEVFIDSLRRKAQKGSVKSNSTESRVCSVDKNKGEFKELGMSTPSVSLCDISPFVENSVCSVKESFLFAVSRCQAEMSKHNGLDVECTVPITKGCEGRPAMFHSKSESSKCSKDPPSHRAFPTQPKKILTLEQYEQMVRKKPKIVARLVREDDHASTAQTLSSGTLKVASRQRTIKRGRPQKSKFQIGSSLFNSQKGRSNAKVRNVSFPKGQLESISKSGVSPWSSRYNRRKCSSHRENDSCREVNNELSVSRKPLALQRSSGFFLPSLVLHDICDPKMLSTEGMAEFRKIFTASKDLEPSLKGKEDCNALMNFLSSHGYSLDRNWCAIRGEELSSTGGGGEDDESSEFCSAVVNVSHQDKQTTDDTFNLSMPVDVQVVKGMKQDLKEPLEVESGQDSEKETVAHGLERDGLGCDLNRDTLCASEKIIVKDCQMGTNVQDSIRSVDIESSERDSLVQKSKKAAEISEQQDACFEKVNNLNFVCKTLNECTAFPDGGVCSAHGHGPHKHELCVQNTCEEIPDTADNGDECELSLRQTSGSPPFFKAINYSSINHSTHHMNKTPASDKETTDSIVQIEHSALCLSEDSTSLLTAAQDGGHKTDCSDNKAITYNLEAVVQEEPYSFSCAEPVAKSGTDSMAGLPEAQTLYRPVPLVKQEEEDQHSQSHLVHPQAQSTAPRIESVDVVMCHQSSFLESKSSSAAPPVMPAASSLSVASEELSLSESVCVSSVGFSDPAVQRDFSKSVAPSYVTEHDERSDALETITHSVSSPVMTVSSSHSVTPHHMLNPVAPCDVSKKTASNIVPDPDTMSANVASDSVSCPAISSDTLESLTVSCMSDSAVLDISENVPSNCSSSSFAFNNISESFLPQHLHSHSIPGNLSENMAPDCVTKPSMGVTDTKTNSNVLTSSQVCTSECDLVESCGLGNLSENVAPDCVTKPPMNITNVHTSGDILTSDQVCTSDHMESSGLGSVSENVTPNSVTKPSVDVTSTPSGGDIDPMESGGSEFTKQKPGPRYVFNIECNTLARGLAEVGYCLRDDWSIVKIGTEVKRGAHISVADQKMDKRSSRLDSDQLLDLRPDLSNHESPDQTGNLSEKMTNVLSSSLPASYFSRRDGEIVKIPDGYIVRKNGRLMKKPGPKQKLPVSLESGSQSRQQKSQSPSKSVSPVSKSVLPERYVTRKNLRLMKIPSPKQKPSFSPVSACGSERERKQNVPSESQNFGCVESQSPGFVLKQNALEGCKGKKREQLEKKSESQLNSVESPGGRSSTERGMALPVCHVSPGAMPKQVIPEGYILRKNGHLMKKPGPKPKVSKGEPACGLSALTKSCEGGSGVGTPACQRPQDDVTGESLLGYGNVELINDAGISSVPDFSQLKFEVASQNAAQAMKLKLGKSEKRDEGALKEESNEAGPLSSTLVHDSVLKDEVFTVIGHAADNVIIPEGFVLRKNGRLMRKPGPKPKGTPKTPDKSKNRVDVKDSLPEKLCRAETHHNVNSEAGSKESLSHSQGCSKAVCKVFKTAQGNLSMKKNDVPLKRSLAAKHGRLIKKASGRRKNGHSEGVCDNGMLSASSLVGRESVTPKGNILPTLAALQDRAKSGGQGAAIENCVGRKRNGFDSTESDATPMKLIKMSQSSGRDGNPCDFNSDDVFETESFSSPHGIGFDHCCPRTERKSSGNPKMSKASTLEEVPDGYFITKTGRLMKRRIQKTKLSSDHAHTPSLINANVRQRGSSADQTWMALTESLNPSAPSSFPTSEEIKYTPVSHTYFQQQISLQSCTTGVSPSCLPETSLPQMQVNSEVNAESVPLCKEEDSYVQQWNIPFSQFSALNLPPSEYSTETHSLTSVVERRMQLMAQKTKQVVAKKSSVKRKVSKTKTKNPPPKRKKTFITALISEIPEGYIINKHGYLVRKPGPKANADVASQNPKTEKTKYPSRQRKKDGMVRKESPSVSEKPNQIKKRHPHNNLADKEKRPDFQVQEQKQKGAEWERNPNIPFGHILTKAGRVVKKRGRKPKFVTGNSLRGGTKHRRKLFGNGMKLAGSLFKEQAKQNSFLGGEFPHSECCEIKQQRGKDRVCDRSKHGTHSFQEATAHSQQHSGPGSSYEHQENLMHSLVVSSSSQSATDFQFCHTDTVDCTTEMRTLHSLPSPAEQVAHSLENSNTLSLKEVNETPALVTSRAESSTANIKKKSGKLASMPEMSGECLGLKSQMIPEGYIISKDGRLIRKRGRKPKCLSQDCSNKTINRYKKSKVNEGPEGYIPQKKNHVMKKKQLKFPKNQKREIKLNNHWSKTKGTSGEQPNDNPFLEPTKTANKLIPHGYIVNKHGHLQRKPGRKPKRQPESAPKGLGAATGAKNGSRKVVGRESVAKREGEENCSQGRDAPAKEEARRKRMSGRIVYKPRHTDSFTGAVPPQSSLSAADVYLDLSQANVDLVNQCDMHLLPVPQSFEASATPMLFPKQEDSASPPSGERYVSNTSLVEESGILVGCVGSSEEGSAQTVLSSEDIGFVQPEMVTAPAFIYCSPMPVEGSASNLLTSPVFVMTNNSWGFGGQLEESETKLTDVTSVQPEVGVESFSGCDTELKQEEEESNFM
ncbi:uncharacterized protein LOC101853001 [Aplysia californica]|uniref:Uncharacterized protein LOC101853001 n=1 Tax=Aplysia californica TaxID=6500 RepID=A0ABM0JQ78_APLCA|nr:uncharacterized protein LOC101853001 [Aplysia californica]